MEITINGKCPNCNMETQSKVDIDPLSFAPKIRGNVLPTELIYGYKITSEDLKQFIIQKAKQYVPDIKIEVIPRYCEKKRRHRGEPHRSYASLKIAFSDNIVERSGDLGWYEKIGENSNCRIVNSLFQNIIQMYKYDRKEIDSWLKSYKIMEELEENLGMTEAYIEDLKKFSTPVRIKTNSSESWIFFAAAAENVIKDYLTEVNTNVIRGKIKIQDIYPISKDVVEFNVHLYPMEIESKENPHVKQILAGEEKAKKY